MSLALHIGIGCAWCALYLFQTGVILAAVHRMRTIINEIKKGVANHTLILIHFINFTAASVLEIACTVFYVYYFALCSTEDNTSEDEKA